MKKPIFTYPIYFYFLILIILLTNCSKPASNIELSPLFSNNIVLQQTAKVAIWGTAQPATMVKAKGTWGASSTAKTDENGNWKLTLETPEAGGPFELTISTQDTAIILKDVLVGEVWLCSGQSNMEMPLKGWPPNDPIDNSAVEIQNANYPQIRMFTVQKVVEDQPTSNLNGNWAVCSPNTAGNFSATAYFFGRELYESLQVPIGLIHSSWGGTPAEAWTEGKYLSEIDDFKNILEEVKQAIPQRNVLNKWLNEKKTLNVADLPEDTRWNNLNLDDGKLKTEEDFENWPTLSVPGLWESQSLKTFDGVVWFKKKIDIPAAWTNTNLKLDLGPIDDMDETYWNGELIGKMTGPGFWNVPRAYSISKDLLLFSAFGSPSLKIKKIQQFFL